MEDQMYHLLQIFVFVCYVALTMGENGHEISCNVSPFLDKTSSGAVLENVAPLVNGICIEDSAMYSKQMCVPETVDHSGSWQTESLITTQGKSSIDKRDNNKSKATLNSKMEMKKPSINKKLKGSKRQRKKEKKKKIGKKRKKS